MPLGGNQIIGEFLKSLTLRVIDFGIVDNATSSVAKSCRNEINSIIERYPDWTQDENIMAALPDVAKCLAGYLDVVYMACFRQHAPTSLLYPSNTNSPLEYTGPQKQSDTSCILINKVIILLYRIACLAAFRKTGDKRFINVLEMITPRTNVRNSIIADIVLDITKGLYDAALGSIERVSRMNV